MTREEALSVLQDKSHFDTSVYGYEAIDVAIETLQQEPVKHGEWIIYETYNCEGGEIHLICSECKSEPMAWSSKRFFNYCPNCGAKMDKGGDIE